MFGGDDMSSSSSSRGIARLVGGVAVGVMVVRHRRAVALCIGESMIGREMNNTVSSLK